MLVRLGRRVGGVSGGAIRPWLAPWLSAPDRADSVRLGGVFRPSVRRESSAPRAKHWSDGQEARDGGRE